MSESSLQQMYDTLQVSSSAEPEVVAAAYRALAKKYHPDRSNAPDAMSRMARLNIAYQTLRVKLSRNVFDEDPFETPIETVSLFTLEKIDASGSLEDVLQVVGRKVASARQHIIDEAVRAGVPRDIATSLVTQAVKEAYGVRTSRQPGDTSRPGERLDPNTSYDKAIEFTQQRTEAARSGVVDELIHSGLQRSAAVELVDAALDKMRKGRDTVQHNRKDRFSTDRVDLNGPLDKGVDVVLSKARAARQMLVDEIAQDGVPLRTAEQLVHTAFERLCQSTKR